MGDKVTEAAFKEMKQLHNIIMFEPIKLADLNSQERKRAMGSLIILLEKRNKQSRLELVQIEALNGST